MFSQFSLSNLPETIPLFPHAGLILFPRCQLPLHIFEPRYISMVDDLLLSDHRMLGLVQPVSEEGGESPGQRAPQLYEVGSAGQVTEVQKVPGGRYNITVTGVSRFRVGTLIEGFSPYLKVSPKWSEFEGDLDDIAGDPGFSEVRFIRLVESYSRARGLKFGPVETNGRDADVIIGTVSMYAPLPSADKQALLELPTLAERRKALELVLSLEVSAGNGMTRQ